MIALALLPSCRTPTDPAAPRAVPLSTATVKEREWFGSPRSAGDRGWWAPGWGAEVGRGFRGEPEGAPARAVLVRYSQYAVAYDPERRSPVWAAYSVDRSTALVAESGARAESRNPAFRRPREFFVEPIVLAASRALGIAVAEHKTYGDAIDPRFPVPASWTRQRAQHDPRIVERGHVVPNNAMKCVGDERAGLLAQRESFSLANVVPQMSGHNAPTWSALEAAVLGWAERYGRVWVLAGPVGGTASMRGRAEGESRGVSMPDAMFLVVVADDGGRLRAGAFVVPHRPERLAYSDDAHVRSVDDVEALTGLDLLPELGEPAAEEAERAFWLLSPEP